MLDIKFAAFSRRFVSTALAVGIYIASASAFGTTTHRPISEFLAVGGRRLRSSRRRF